MAVLKRGQLPKFVLPRETVEVPELGGEVVVMGMGYSLRMSLLAALKRAGGGGEVDASAVLALAPVVLAEAVVDADDQPLMAQEGWEEFGRQHREAIERLTAILLRISGFDREAARKNS
jgi:hypothetical protein